MIVIPLAEYHRLPECAEDIADIEAYDRAKARLASGEDELIPSGMVDRMLDGENAVQVWREYRGITTKALAAAAGVSALYLSQIEAGKREGSIATMKKLAAALKVTVDDLV